MCDNIHILIIDDEASIYSLLDKILLPLVKKWPNSEITKVKTKEKAFAILQKYPLPDIVLHDLKLPDSGIEETLKTLDEVEDKSPVLVLTGYDINWVRSLITYRTKHLEILSKDDILKDGFLINAIINAISKWSKPKGLSNMDKIERNLVKLRELADVIRETSPR